MEVHQSSSLVTSDPESIIRYAIDQKADVSVIERMMAVRDKLQSEFAKKQYDEALAAFQNQCPIIMKRKQGAKNAYVYAPFEDIIHQTKDLIRKHGFSYRITSVTTGNLLKAICKITHSAGHSEISEFEVPIDNKNPMMSDPQRFGGARTFASRYAFCGGFGIVTMDSDMDGRMQRDKPAGPSRLQTDDLTLRPLAQELWDTLKPIRKEKEQNWNSANYWLTHNDITVDGELAPNFTAERFKEIIESSKKIISATGAK